MSVTNIGTSGRVPVHVESYRDKFLRRFREEPLVPIGALATTVALLMAFTKMRGGNAKSFNNWLRFRVVAQGLTIAAVVGGTYFYGQTKQQKETRASEEAAKLATEREQERLAFEQRLKDAEETYAQESSAQSGLATFGGSGETAVVSETRSAPSTSSGGWFGWLGGRGGSEKSN